MIFFFICRYYLITFTLCTFYNSIRTEWTLSTFMNPILMFFFCFTVMRKVAGLIFLFIKRNDSRIWSVISDIDIYHFFWMDKWFRRCREIFGLGIFKILKLNLLLQILKYYFHVLPNEATNLLLRKLRKFHQQK